MIGVIENKKTIDGRGWFINNFPLHIDDIEQFVNYDGKGNLIHEYEGKEVEYCVEDYNNSFFGTYKVARIILK